MHRSHDREALNESREEPEPALGSGSSSDAPGDSPKAPQRLLDLRQRQHDAANWLAVLRGHLDLLAHDHDAAPSVRGEWLDRARSAAAAAERLLRGAEVRSSTHSPVGVVLQDIAGHAHTILPAAVELRLDLDLPSERGTALGDDDLEDVLLNLLRNAGRALRERGGGVTVRAREHGPEDVLLEVEDDGPGMSEEVRRRCLEPGFTTREGGRGGLGLSRVVDVVRTVDGRVEMDSAPGEGTRVRLLLPGAVADRTAAPVRLAAGRPGMAVTPGGVARVLVVDDDPDVSEVLGVMLDRLGAHTVRAADAEDARRQLRRLQFDVVIVDRELPDRRGDDLALEIRQADPTLAIVLLSGDPAADSPGASMPEVFDRGLTKPVGLDTLRVLLDELLPLTRDRRAEVDDA